MKDCKVPVIDISGLRDFLASEGCVLPDIALLQPAEPFLDTAGEDLRRRIFLTSDRDGSNHCLRPEFTIPVCRHHLNASNGAMRYGYCGTVFRQDRAGSVEFEQAGIEDFGAIDRATADARAIADAHRMLAFMGCTPARTIVGDRALFADLLLALELPPAWCKRLSRVFGANDEMQVAISRLELAGGSSAEITTVTNDKLPALTAQVVEMMHRHGISPTAGRTPADIAARQLETIELQSATLAPNRLAALKAFLDIETPLGSALDAISTVENAAGIDLGPSKQFFARRAEQIAALHDVEIIYRAGFGRRLDYYTGLFFELVDETGQTLAGGGRYDKLLTMLGAIKPVPAVGFSVWIDRVMGA